MDEDELAIRRRRLRHRCRYRGFLEADLLLDRFARAWLDRLDRAELDRLEALLEEPDVDIWDWATGRRPVPARHEGALMRILQDFARTGGAVEGRA
ncbi:MAG: succinate dehydrogenase assembly factor 2 [Geminicoccaceae bacterium]|nr:succinate dehydrogenase assembly factor 2 [Geminicoccaceae bacterium]MCX8100930.1 succinate dehydrogenase assembly factor 2 [Geminicoccaceae bacterium]MDW8368643.1 succinate dehydrogenase assembly factor 2 [Geminicoccaceae bacterium]